MRFRTIAAVASAFIATGCNHQTPPTNNPGSPNGIEAPELSSPATIKQKFAGSSFTLRVDEAPGESVAVQRMVAKGPVGVAFVDSLLVFKTHNKNAMRIAVRDNKHDPRCPDAYPYGTDLVSATWVQVYKDSSAFTGAVPKEKIGKYAVCTNGVDFRVEVKGKILSGAGPRFDGVTGGTWQATGTVTDFRMRGTFEANLER